MVDWVHRGFGYSRPPSRMARSIIIMKRNYYLFSSGRLRKKDFSLAFENVDGRKYIPVEDVDSIPSTWSTRSIFFEIVFLA